MIPLYQVDAFADGPFTGNPAAVCPLDDWLPDALLQQIAAENNLSETAFFVGGNGAYQLRWFTPLCEVDLCGHATLASAWVIFNRSGDASTELKFETRSGVLKVRQIGSEIELDLPAQLSSEAPLDPLLCKALGVTAQSMWLSDDAMLVFESQALIESIVPDIQALARLPYRGIIVTAPGDEHDFVSRFFGPAVGVNEDPVTGSAHCKLTPYWAASLQRNLLSARQCSARGGLLQCQLLDDRVLLRGQGRLFLDGRIVGLEQL